MVSFYGTSLWDFAIGLGIFLILFWAGIGWMFPKTFLRGPLKDIPVQSTTWGRRHYFTNPMLAALVLDSFRRTAGEELHLPFWAAGIAGLLALPVLATTTAPLFHRWFGESRLTRWVWGVYHDESQGRVHHLLWICPLAGSFVLTFYPELLRRLERL
jgi:hypothetical protein